MVYYFSDGAASQNFLNLCYHQADFGIPAQWQHGKGGLGGTVKRLAARASLQRQSSSGPQTVCWLRTIESCPWESISEHDSFTLETKRLSKNERVTKQDMDIHIELVSGYVTCVHNNYWWLGCVRTLKSITSSTWIFQATGLTSIENSQNHNWSS